MSHESELDQIRLAAEGVLEKARNDEAYCAELMADPVGVLAAAGVPADAAAQIASSEFGEPDVQQDAAGFMMTGGCNYGTCIITACSHIPQTGHTGCGLLTIID